MAEHASEWGFLKLLISLDTGLIGLVIYGHEHFPKLSGARAVIPVTLALLGGSFAQAMRSARHLVNVDGMRESYGDKALSNPEENRLVREWRGYSGALKWSMWLFGLAVATSVIFFVFAFAIKTT